MLALVDPESRVPAAYPIRAVRALADAALTELSPVFDAMYAETGRPSVPPERLLKASLLMALYSVRSERAFREQLDYKLLFRWFLGMDLAEPSFDPTVFTKNRQRLLRHRVAQEFFDVVVAQARRRNLMSEEHFSVDGTLIEAAASLKSFRPHDEEPPPGLPDDRGNPLVDFHGQKRSNATHASTTDPEARLMRKGNGNEAKLVFVAHALMENRNGLLADLQTTEADGYAERDVALEMLDQAADRGFRPKTLASEVNLTVDAAIKSAFRARRNTNWLDIARRSGGEAVRGVGGSGPDGEAADGGELVEDPLGGGDLGLDRAVEAPESPGPSQLAAAQRVDHDAGRVWRVPDLERQFDVEGCVVEVVPAIRM